VFWIAIWLAPVAAVSLIQRIDSVERDAANVRERIAESAGANAAQEENVFASGEQFLRTLANQPQIREPWPDCANALEDALNGLQYFTDIVPPSAHRDQFQEAGGAPASHDGITTAAPGPGAVQTQHANPVR
jgi:hypothetical protein